MRTVLTIAGSDCSGGAGIQADIKTICAHKLYAMSVITALTAQNTTGVYGVQEVEAEFVGKQMDSIFTDIVPNAVKIGMVSSAETMDVIAAKLKQYHVKNVVVDTVMVSSSGSRLLKADAVGVLTTKLLPGAALITPNLPEAEVLCGFPIKGREQMKEAARILSEKTGSAVLIKGGHLENCADDLLYAGGDCRWFFARRVDTSNTHGTGCTLSAAIACNLALGQGLEESVRQAKAYLTGALMAGLDLGKGRGPLDHLYNLI